MVMPCGNELRRPNVAFSLEKCFERKIETVTCLVSPGLRVRLLSERLMVNSVLGNSDVACANERTTTKRNESVRSVFIMLIGLFLVETKSNLPLADHFEGLGQAHSNLK